MTAHRTDDETGFEGPIAVAAAVAFVGAGGHWLAANLAVLLTRGEPLDGGLVDSFHALTRLPNTPGDPKLAWEGPAADQLPGPILYWLSVALVVATALGIAIVALRYRWGREQAGPDKRTRLGVETQARFAKTADLRPLLIRRPEKGRFVLGRWGRRYLATEGTHSGRQRGVRGAVAICGPSQSGKTTGLIDSVRLWDGPAVISSVKADILHATIEQRSKVGEVKVFDPLGITGHESAQWTPLDGVRTIADAVRAAGMLVRAGGPEPTGNDRFWRGQAEQLLAGMLWTAANTDGHTMAHVVRWVLELDIPGDDKPGTLAPLVRLLADHDDSAIAADAKIVQGWLHGQWGTDPRTTSSVYATAREAVWPWADPGIAASAGGCDITLDWLLDGNNTLYLCAPLGDETRVGLVFSALLHDLISRAFDRANRTGVLEPRLLILIDEAANTVLHKLPEWAATVTGAGMQLVTVWQSKAQLDQIYDHHADTVLTNHRTKLIYPSGLSDLATVTYIRELVGTEHVRGDLDNPRAGWEHDRRPGTPSVELSLVDTKTLRGMKVGDALLVHGNLPPAWVKARRRALR